MAALDHASQLERLTPEEYLLVQNHRRCTQVRRDALLYLSGQMAEHPPLEHQQNILKLFKNT